MRENYQGKYLNGYFSGPCRVPNIILTLLNGTDNPAP